MNNVNRDEIIQQTRAALAGLGPRYTFEIVEPGVRQDDAWWYVPVIARTARGEEAPYELVVNIYANIEDQLQGAGVNVLFVPTAA